MRINAYLARSGVAARRKADQLIKAGRVSLNSQPAKLNDQVETGDKVTLDGQPVSAMAMTYIVLNKPRGVITSTFDPEGRRTVSDIVTVPKGVVPVGRLDYNTSGLLLLTNDGQLAAKLMHPKYKVAKVYLTHTKEQVSDDHIKKLLSGVQLEDGSARASAVVKLDSTSLLITLTQGRNRQVRRMIAALGLSLVSLKRVSYGPINIDNLASGATRPLSQQELQALMKSPQEMVQ